MKCQGDYEITEEVPASWISICETDESKTLAQRNSVPKLNEEDSKSETPKA